MRAAARGNVGARPPQRSSGHLLRRCSSTALRPYVCFRLNANPFLIPSFRRANVSFIMRGCWECVGDGSAVDLAAADVGGVGGSPRGGVDVCLFAFCTDGCIDTTLSTLLPGC